MRVARLKWIGGVGLLTVAVVLLIVVLVRPPSQPPLPNPNGYADFVQAGAGVNGPVTEYQKLDREGLESLLAANAESLRLVRVGLARQCRLPLDSALANLAGLTGQLGGMKRLAQLLAAEGRLRELENKPGEAAQSYVEAMRFGNQMSRGGLLITRLVGISCEAIGYTSLTGVVPQLNREQSQAILAQLQALEATHVTWAEVRDAENQCIRFHLKQRLNPAVWVIGWWQTRQALHTAEMRDKTTVAHERLLLTELALRCFKMDSGAAPKTLQELVPRYLTKVPQDPFVARPLVYQPQPSAKWALYSVGPDGVDDGGRRAVGRGPQPKGDILLGPL